MVMGMVLRMAMASGKVMMRFKLEYGDKGYREGGRLGWSNGEGMGNGFGYCSDYVSSDGFRYSYSYGDGDGTGDGAGDDDF